MLKDYIRPIVAEVIAHKCAAGKEPYCTQAEIMIRLSFDVLIAMRELHTAGEYIGFTINEIPTLKPTTHNAN